MEEQGTGAPAKPAAPPPAAPPMAPSPPAVRKELLASRLVNRGGLIVGVVTIGVLLLAAAVLLRVPSFVDPSLFPPQDYLNFLRILFGASALLVDVSMFLLLILALLVGVLRTDLSDSTRKGFMAFALILFFFWFISVLFQSRTIFPFP